MGVSKEKLAEIDGALADLGKDEEEVSAVLRRFEGAEPVDFAAADGELDALKENIEITPIASPVIVDPSTVADPSWDGEETEVEVIDAEDDFVLLVDEGDLEELEAASDEIPNVTVPPPIPKDSTSADSDEDSDAEQEEEEEGFFKKLFGSRRPSNRP